MLNISKPAKTDLDRELTTVANDTFRIAQRWHRMYSYFATLTDQDLTGYGYDANDIYAIRAACLAFENMYLGYQKQTLLSTDKPAQYIEPLVQVLVI